MPHTHTQMLISILALLIFVCYFVAKLNVVLEMTSKQSIVKGLIYTVTYGGAAVVHLA